MDEERLYDEEDTGEGYEENETYSQGIRPIAPPPPALSQKSDEYLYQREMGITTQTQVTVSDTDEEDKVPKRNSKIAQRIANTKLIQNSYKLYEKSTKTKVLIFIGFVVLSIACLIVAYILLSK